MKFQEKGNMNGIFSKRPRSSQELHIAKLQQPLFDAFDFIADCSSHTFVVLILDQLKSVHKSVCVIIW